MWVRSQGGETQGKPGTLGVPWADWSKSEILCMLPALTPRVEKAATEEEWASCYYYVNWRRPSLPEARESLWDGSPSDFQDIIQVPGHILILRPCFRGQSGLFFLTECEFFHPGKLQSQLKPGGYQVLFTPWPSSGGSEMGSL